MAAAAAVTKAPVFPGFTKLTDQIFVRPADTSATTTVPTVATPHPDTVVIYGWGDGLPRHVAKFTDGYRVLFPRAKQIVVLSPIRKAVFYPLSSRTAAMMPLVKELFPNGKDTKDTILMHVMSNAGGINYASTLNGYRNLFNTQLPHQLAVMDSTPGSTTFTWSNLVLWSRAMALGVSKVLPLPFIATHFLCGIFVLLHRIFELLRMNEPAGSWSRKAVKNPTYKTMASRNLYMYSKEDDLIMWKDVEENAAMAKKTGWNVDVEMFKGSGHVAHMRQHPEQYWAAILKAWQKVVDDGLVKQKMNEEKAVA